MNRASPATGWVRNPVMKSPELDPTQASSYELGWTFNPITGCLTHIDGMCKGGGFPCYAYRLANGRLRERYLANENVAVRNGIITESDITDKYQMAKFRQDPFYPRFWPERIDELDISKQKYCQFKNDKGIFVCDMGELFGDWLPREWQDEVFRIIRMRWNDRFYLLTKQPQNLPQFSPYPENCYVGVTVTQKDKIIPALDALDSIQCSIRYLSIEPMLGRFDIPDLDILLGGTVNQVIIGAMTFRGSVSGIYPQLTPMPDRNQDTLQPKIEWVREIVEACDRAGIPVFLKDNLYKLLFERPVDDLYWEDMANLRQEMPK